MNLKTLNFLAILQFLCFRIARAVIDSHILIKIINLKKTKRRLRPQDRSMLKLIVNIYYKSKQKIKSIVYNDILWSLTIIYRQHPLFNFKLNIFLNSCVKFNIVAETGLTPQPKGEGVKAANSITKAHAYQAMSFNTHLRKTKQNNIICM